MKNLILKWCGLTPSFIGEVIRITVREEMVGYVMKQREENTELVTNRLNNRYDIDGMSSKLDDMEYSLQDLESRGNDWDDMRDQLENIDFDKVQELDDRLTELLAGYKLEVKLTQENY